MTFDLGDDLAWRWIERFYRKEVRLLQSGQYADWLSVFAPEFRYRVPVVRVTDERSAVVAPDGELGYYDENRETMQLRVDKLASTMAWTEIPPSRLRYFVQLTDLYSDASGLKAVSNVLLYQTRLESRENIFYGERFDQFVEIDGEFKIAERKVVLDKSRLAAENLSVFL